MEKIERSSGVIVWRHTKDGKVEFLILKNIKNNWSIPKGHIKKGESEKQCALRETYEEAGIKVNLIKGFKKVYKHRRGVNRIKRISVFLSNQHTKDNISIPYNEIKEYKWITCEELSSIKIMKQLKNLLIKTDEYIKNIAT